VYLHDLLRWKVKLFVPTFLRKLHNLEGSQMRLETL
jgi:hypothetical protein